MSNYFYDTNLAITKYNIAKDGELKDLEINGQNIQLGGEVARQSNKAVTISSSVVIEPSTGYETMDKVTATLSVPLYAWKYSSNYIYSRTIPTAAGSVNIITTPVLDDATGTYGTGSEAQSHDIWKIGTTFYNSDLSTGTAPAGSAGTPVDLGDVVIATDTKWYMKDSDSWYEVVELETDQAVLSSDAVSDATLLAELEAATAAELDYVEYTEPAVPAGITYSGNIYERYTTGDYTVE